jgi:DNA-binding LacI/PurR family transcriptional regulator
MKISLAKPVSIKDIARMAGVTHSTVSRALRNSPLVNRETVERIQRIALESGYRTSAAARSLVTRRSDTIGVVVTNIADPFVAGVVGGIEEAADEHGLSVFLANSNAEPEREVRVARKFEERRVDGIIVTASRVGAQYVPLLEHMQVPIVLLNNQHPSQFAHSVMIANVQASLDATRHLIALGHRRIAYLGDRYGYQSDRPWRKAACRSTNNWWRTETASRKAPKRRSRSCSPCFNHPPPSSATTICRHWAPCGRSATMACGFPRTSPSWVSTTCTSASI